MRRGHEKRAYYKDITDIYTISLRFKGTNSARGHNSRSELLRHICSTDKMNRFLIAAILSVIFTSALGEFLNFSIPVAGIRRAFNLDLWTTL